MTEHTPGPWIVAPSSNPQNGSAWRDIHSTGDAFAGSYVGEALARDASLIAAAPDLLAALEMLRAAVERDKDARYAVGTAILTAADNAIEAARGAVTVSQEARS